MLLNIRFDIRHVLSASLLTAAMAMPSLAQETAPAETAPAGDAAAAQSGDTAAPEAAEAEILDDVALGDESAPLTIYEYASFTCPHCAAFHEESFPQLKSEYIDTGRVRFIQRDVYFDQVGLWAGVLARCDESKFYPVADMLMSEQSDWMGAENGEALVASLRKIGAKAGLTAEQIDACWEDQSRVQNLVATFQANATQDQIDATPTFVINGEKIQNQPWADFKTIIDEKLAEAEDAAPAE